MLTTERLRIVAPSLDDFRAFREGGGAALAARLGAAVPAEWPVFPETVEPPERVEPADPWGTYWGLHAADATLILEGGVAAPDADGESVFGYGLVPAYRGRGLATEFAGALVALAFADGRARGVTAFTFPAGAVSPEGHPADPSIAVLRRLGFSCVDRGVHWRWRLTP